MDIKKTLGNLGLGIGIFLIIGVVLVILFFIFAVFKGLIVGGVSLLFPLLKIIIFLLVIYVLGAIVRKVLNRKSSKESSKNSFCPKCGQEINNSDDFCINCGLKLK